MSLAQTLTFAGLALLGGWLTNPRSRARANFLLVCSVLAIFWLQPALPIRYLDFWLPCATLAVVWLSWALSATPEQQAARENWLTGGGVCALALLAALTRFLPLDPFLTASTPPPFWELLLPAGLLALIVFALGKWKAGSLPGLGIAALIGLLIVQKTPALGEALSALLRAANGQALAPASGLDLRWLGFSYIAFRLIHTLRDRQEGRLKEYSLQETFIYVIFFPAITAGPIDRIDNFSKALRSPAPLDRERLTQAGMRFFVGLFKKYVLADGLALIALNGSNALQVRGAGWAWVLLYAYSLQIYLDFSGYTDIVIGIAQVLGFNLPENFNAPYLKPNLTQFWNNWHISLTQWFRAYYFNPLNRWLRKAKIQLAMPLQVLILQVSTMLLIGLWHGITPNFMLWGLWHGLGLFAHNRWSDSVGPRIRAWAGTPARKVLLDVGGVLITFHFVALGWVFFALPSLSVSMRFFQVLLGGNG